MGTNEARWAAVVGRDAAAVGRFVFSVATTGVYCRPGCPSKLALRRNVDFYETCADAEKAGFRPCKRCRPNEPPLFERWAESIRKACASIEAAETPPALDALARAAGLSRFHFLRVFRRTVGVTPGQYASQHRAGRVRSELRNGESVTDAIYGAGFNSSSRFYENSPETLGMTPCQFRDGGAGVAIQYAVAECSLGLVLVAGTARGICSVRFGDDAPSLVNELHASFPRASVAKAGPDFNGWLNAVVHGIDHSAAPVDLPLDIQGTAFQTRIWKALREIPPGSTTTYAELARRIGSPKAVRAVGSACGANPVAVLVPCHRVVRSDGGISGYRWGVERKRELLRRESLEQVRGS